MSPKRAKHGAPETVTCKGAWPRALGGLSGHCSASKRWADVLWAPRWGSALRSSHVDRHCRAAFSMAGCEADAPTAAARLTGFLLVQGSQRGMQQAARALQLQVRQVKAPPLCASACCSPRKKSASKRV